LVKLRTAESRIGRCKNVRRRAALRAHPNSWLLDNQSRCDRVQQGSRHPHPRLGPYEVPVFRLGWLTVSLSVQSSGLGGELLLAVGSRALSVAVEVGRVALAIDARNERTALWYERFGALRLIDDPLKLVLPLKTIADALALATKG